METFIQMMIVLCFDERTHFASRDRIEMCESAFIAVFVHSNVDVPAPAVHIRYTHTYTYIAHVRAAHLLYSYVSKFNMRTHMSTSDGLEMHSLMRA